MPPASMRRRTGDAQRRADTARQKAAARDGGTTKHLDIPGADLEGVRYLRWLDDSDALRTAAARTKQAAVIGGKFIGVEVAAALVHYKVETTVIVKARRSGFVHSGAYRDVLPADARGSRREVPHRG